MSDPSSIAPERLPEWVDAIADRFERAWRQVRPPCLADYLGSATGEARRALLEELQKIDRIYRQPLCQQPQSPDAQAETGADPGGAAPALSAALAYPRIPRCQILAELGRGGAGIVYQARQTAPHRTVAVKILRAGLDASPERLKRFRAESEAVAQLQHANIVQVYEVGDDYGQPYLVMEYVAGGSLEEKLAGTPLPARPAARLLETLARAMHVVHQHKIIHRDLKPANVLLTSDGIPKITDFGLAKQLETSGSPTRTGDILGTPSYMAPEQAQGKPKEIGPAADVYALGAILYEMLTGRPPHRGETMLETLDQVRNEPPVPPSRLQPKLPRDLETICLKALAKEPHHRYASAASLADDLRRFLEGRPILARPVSRPARAWRWCRRNPAVATLLAAVVVVLLAGTGLSTYFAVQARQQARAADDRLYIADMRVLQRAWEEENMVWFTELLDRHRPGRSGEDRAGFEWHYWNRRFHSGHITLSGHTNNVRCAVFSPDGKRLASAGVDRVVRIWDLNTNRELHRLTGHDATVSFLAFDQEETRLISAADDGRVIVWDAANGREWWTVMGSGGPVVGAACSPDGNRLTVAHDQGPVRTWDLRARRMVKAVDFGPIWSCALSPDGLYLVVIPKTGLALRVANMDPESGFLTRDFEGGELALPVVGASTAGLLGSVGGPGPWLAAAAPGPWLAATALFPGRAGKIDCLEFSPHNHRLALASGGIVFVWEWPACRLRATRRTHAGQIDRLAFSADESQLAVAGHDGKTVLWDVDAGQEPRPLSGSTKPAWPLAFSRDGRTLAAGLMNGTAKVWDLAQGTEPRTLRGHTSEVGIALSPDGRWLASFGANRSVQVDPSIKVWDLSVGQEPRTLPPHSDRLYTVAFAPDGHTLASPSDDGTVAIWDLTRGREVYTFRGHQACVNGAAWRDGRLLASSSDDETVKVWDATTGQVIRSLPHHAKVWSVAFRPGGRQLATGADDGKVRVWDLSSGRKLTAPLDGDSQFVLGMAFSPDGRRLASAGGNGMVTVWDAGDWHKLFTLSGHQAAVWCVAFSPDGKLLASGSNDHTVRLWDMASGREVFPFPLRGHNHYVSGVAFSPDGQRLASASWDGTARLWDVASGQELLTLKGHGKAVFGVAFSPDGQRLATSSWDKTIKIWDATPLINP